MINSANSKLYKLSSKKYLLMLLKITDKNYLKQSYIAKQISPYIEKNPKPRLIEAPSESLKKIQKKSKTN